MTRTSLLSDAVRVEPSPGERAVATKLAAALARPAEHELSLVMDDGTAVPLSPGLWRVLRVSIDELAEGHAVTLLPSEAELTPAEAADVLGLSRPFVVRLLDAGEIPSRHLPGSRHRRVKLSDVVAFQARRTRRREGRRRIAEIIDDAELPY